MRPLYLSSAIFAAFKLCSYESFRYFSQFARVKSMGAISGSFATDFEELSQICKAVAVPSNTTATLINLIQYGDTWAADAKRKSTGEFDRYKKGDKVPGCMADVRIVTTFIHDLDGKECTENRLGKSPRISIEGSADSRVAQGILALLCQVNRTLVNSTFDSLLHESASLRAQILPVTDLPFVIIISFLNYTGTS